jgi:hypothetical protein
MYRMLYLQNRCYTLHPTNVTYFRYIIVNALNNNNNNNNNNNKLQKTAILGTAHKLQKTAILGTAHILRKVLM